MKIKIVIGKKDCYFKVINDDLPNVYLDGNSYKFNCIDTIRFSPSKPFQKVIGLYHSLCEKYDVQYADPNIIADIFYYFQLAGYQHEDSQYKRFGTYPNSSY
ncbi:MAG: hypothetical protein RSC93_00955 [Erysipelotrichaceae bacterium]